VKSGRGKWGLIGYMLAVFLGLLLLNRMRVMKTLAMIQLSPNFNLSEFVSTATGLENTPDEEAIGNLRALAVNVLQPLRSALGKPVRITSGYRSRLVNEVIGGVDTSQHLTGEAADIQIDGYSPVEIVRQIRALQLPFDQLIDEQVMSRSWVHVSYKKIGNRKQALSARWNGAQSKVVYTTFVG
jgi:zinc D-Ala-D-Ala carboxypeptidase